MQAQPGATELPSGKGVYHLIPMTPGCQVHDHIAELSFKIAVVELSQQVYYLNVYGHWLHSIDVAE